MAKRVTTNDKRSITKRETNLERAARESRHRDILRDANRTAEIIRTTRKTKTEAELVAQSPLPHLARIEVSGLGKRWKEVYAYLGYICCRSDKDPPKFFRLVADILEGKPPYSPGADWYDAKITKAYNAALNRILSGRDRDWFSSDIMRAYEEGDLFSRDVLLVRDLAAADHRKGVFLMPLPSFPEFLQIFLEQNPESKLPRLPSERSLRRSLARLGCSMRRDKRGRPKRK